MDRLGRNSYQSSVSFGCGMLSPGQRSVQIDAELGIKEFPAEWAAAEVMLEQEGYLQENGELQLLLQVKGFR